MTGPTGYRIEPDSRHTLVTNRTIYHGDFSNSRSTDPDSPGSVEFLSRVGLVQVGALPDATRSLMGFGLSIDAFKAMPDLILAELQDAQWSEASVVIDDEPTPAFATTYRGLDFVFPLRWPPPETDFTIHRVTGLSLATDWPKVTTIYSRYPESAE